VAKIAYEIGFAKPSEYTEIGASMADVYSSLEGFPSRADQPNYYSLFDNLTTLVDNPATDLISARNHSGKLLGSVIYFADMKYYGSGGTATSLQSTSGLRLLAVNPGARSNGIGRALTQKCIELAREKQQSQVVLHTTQYMNSAWALYENMGFGRFEEIDFLQGELPVSGFRLVL
jgi:GNAT superfamily N-acetyltransferase